MRRILGITLAVCLLTACAKPEPEVLLPRPTPIPEPEVLLPRPAPIPEPEVIVNTRRVSYELNYINMALELPEDWDYGYVGNTVDEGELHVPPADVVGLRIWPAGETQGFLSVHYYREGFGVCGTGLATEKSVLGDMPVTIGTYDNRSLWDYITLDDAPGSYVVVQEGAEDWWEEYGGTAMAILDTLEVGAGCLSRSQATALAEEVCTVEHDRIRTDFEADTGGWRVSFYQSDAVGGDQVVFLTRDGQVEATEYGE